MKTHQSRELTEECTVTVTNVDGASQGTGVEISILWKHRSELNHLVTKNAAGKDPLTYTFSGRCKIPKRLGEVWREGWLSAFLFWNQIKINNIDRKPSMASCASS